MVRFARLQTLQRMQEVGVIPVFYNSDFEKVKNIINACANAGVVFVGMGSKLIIKDLVEKKDFKALEKNIKQTIAIINEIRK